LDRGEAHQTREHCGVEVLLVDELVRADAEGRFADSRVLVRGEHDDRTGGDGDDALQRVQARRVGQPQVGKHEVEDSGAQRAQRLVQRLGHLEARTPG
jgi:hypothetical protein